MKKLLSVLLIVMLAASVFALEGTNTVKVKSVVGMITLEAAHEDTASGLYTLSVDGADNTATYTSENDISKADVTATFRITQNHLTRTNEDITLTVSASKLTNAEGTHSSNAAEIVKETFATNGTFSKDHLEVTPTFEANTVSLHLVYKGVAKPIKEGTEVASFKATWAKTESLGDFDGEYIADITLTYTKN